MASLIVLGIMVVAMLCLVLIAHNEASRDRHEDYTDLLRFEDEL